MNGKRILLVIGNPSTLTLLGELFVAAGARVSGTSYSEQEPGRHHLFRPDLVIMDLELAGLEAGQRATRFGFPQKTPTILLTTLGEEYRSNFGLQLDGAECFDKPFSADALLSRAQQLTCGGSRFATIIRLQRGSGSQPPRNLPSGKGIESTRFASSGAEFGSAPGFRRGGPPSIVLH